MSRFFSDKYNALVPYTPGEQPHDTEYIKLNTNESPFPPSERAVKYSQDAAGCLQLYSDPTCSALNRALCKTLGVGENEILATNGSDEILNFAFMAFCDDKTGAAFPDITYGFYPVFAQLGGISYTEIPLMDDFTINIQDYFGIGKTIFIANPNAPTGILLKRSEIEEILKANPDNVVVVDEAYIDFGGESCVPLIHKYENLLVTQTFSKSRSMAGARLGFGVGCASLIQDINTVKYSTNPYNVNRMSMAAGIGSLEDAEYTAANCAKITENREYTARGLKQLGFTLTDSRANFVFASHPQIDGKELYLRLREKGILVRHFDKKRISRYNRITIGTKEQMTALLTAIKEILEV